MRSALSALALVATLASSLVARADLPPPDGEKFVGFAFTVQNVKAFPDAVLLAYPYSTSNGAPTLEHAVVQDGQPLDVGRRSGSVQLYTMKRADYETWKQTYKPGTDRFDDPELKKLFESDRVSKCDTAPSPEFVLPKSDPRDTVTQTLRLESAKPCHIVAANAAAKTTPPEPKTTAAKDPLPFADPPPADSPPNPTPAAPPKSGCGGCAMGGTPSPLGAASFAALAAAALLRRRRAR